MKRNNNEKESGNFIPADEKQVTDIKILKIFTDPLRMKILSRFKQPAVIKEVSAELKISPQKLNYHVKLLKKSDLLTIVGTRVISGIIENTYQCTAFHFRPSPELFRSTDDYEEEMSDVIRNFFNGVRNDYIKLQKKLEIKQKKEDSIQKPDAGLSKVKISKTKYKEVLNKIIEFRHYLDQLEQDSKNGSEQSMNVIFFNALFWEAEDNE